MGTPGGDGQDQHILQTLLNVILGGQNLQQAIEAPRLESSHFHQSFDDKRDAPGVLEIEGRVPADVLFALERRGHLLEVRGPYGIATAGVAVGIAPELGTLRGGADIRGFRQAFGW